MSASFKESPLTERAMGPSSEEPLCGWVRAPRLIVSGGLILATLLLFSRVFACEFVNVDDPLYVTANSHVRSGLTAENVLWALTTTEDCNWIPLTQLSLQLDATLFGLNPAGYHGTNLVLHIANAVLLFLALSYMTGELVLSAGVALLFAIHPLHVESVAWIAERKDVLSTLFWMLTLLAYARYAKKPSFGRFAAVCLLFFCGLCAKSMLVTLPFTLLLLDYWPLRRCPFLPMNDPHARSAGARFQQSTMPRLVVEKLPLIALSICFSWITFKAQGAAMLSLGSLPWRYRLMNAADAYLAYLWKTLRPLELAHLYPHSYPDSVTTRSTIVAVVAATGLGATSLWIVRRWRRQPYLAVGWCWYLGTLVPVIGLVQIGEQARADRYTYVPLIGIFICAAWSLQELVRGGRVSGRSVSALCLVAFVSFGACTWKQVGYWKNGSTLWRHAIEVSGPYWGACQYLGTDLLLRGRPREALPYLSKAVRLGPLEEKSHFFLGITFMELGDNSSALDEFERAVRLNPENVESHQNLAAVLRREGRSSEAKAHLREALQIYPGWWRSHLLLSDILKSEGRVEDADHHLRQALAINPNALDDFNRPRADISAHYHRQ